MIWSVLRNIIGVILILTLIPPITMGLFNRYVLLPALMGLGLLLWPVIRSGIQKISGNQAHLLITSILVLTILTGLFFISGTIIILIGSNTEEIPQDATVVVLGAQVIHGEPSSVLAHRIKAAAEYLDSHPQAVCIATGGIGADKSISEGGCIRKTLIQKYNIAPERIYTEETSVNTVENLKNCRKIIVENQLSTNIALVTNEFHMFRSKILSSRQCLTPYPLKADIDWRLLFSSYFRECLALPKSIIFDR